MLGKTWVLSMIEFSKCIQVGIISNIFLLLHHKRKLVSRWCWNISGGWEPHSRRWISWCPVHMSMECLPNGIILGLLPKHNKFGWDIWKTNSIILSWILPSTLQQVQTPQLQTTVDASFQMEPYCHSMKLLSLRNLGLTCNASAITTPGRTSTFLLAVTIHQSNMQVKLKYFRANVCLLISEQHFSW